MEIVTFISIKEFYYATLTEFYYIKRIQVCYTYKFLLV